MRGYTPLHLFDRFHVGVAQIHREQRSSGRKMHVGIDEAWSNRAAAKIDDVGLGTGHRLDLRSRTDRRDLTSGDGHRLRDRIISIHRQYNTIDQRGINGRLGLRLATCYTDEGDQRDDCDADDHDEQPWNLGTMDLGTEVRSEHHRNGFTDRIDDAIDLRVGGDERRRQADAIHHHARVEPAVEHRLGQFLCEASFGRELLPRGLVRHNLDRRHQPKAADVADTVHRLEAAQPAQQSIAGGGGAFGEALALENVDVGQGDGATGGMSRVGEGMHPTLARRHVVDHLANRIRDADAAERDVSARDPLRELHDVGFDAVMLQSEPSPGAPEAGDHFVGDEQHVMLRQISRIRAK